MSPSSQAIIDERRSHRVSPPADAGAARAARPAIELAIHGDLAAIEEEWRRFEGVADCTVFQTFDWLSAWHRHIGKRAGVTPAIVCGRGNDGELVVLMPLAITPGVVRRLTWLGSELCDYNAPLLAAGFSDRMASDAFRELWQGIRRQLQREPVYRHDLVELSKMPETVGAQPNPFLALDVGLHPSGAHSTQLRGSWDEFYQAKRSSSTRRRDRSKLKRLTEYGEVAFVTPRERDEIERTLAALIEQKTKSFSRMGVANIFARPGWPEFFLDIATNPRTRELVHVSRLDVGATWAAINLGLVFHDCYYHVLASYDDGETSRFGPGVAHLRELMGHAINFGCRRFDFTIGDERYKSEWADTTLALYDHVAPATARGWPWAMLLLAHRRLKRTIKQNRLLWSVASRLRSALSPKSARTSDADQESPPDGRAKSPPIAPE